MDLTTTQVDLATSRLRLPWEVLIPMQQSPRSRARSLARCTPWTLSARQTRWPVSTRKIPRTMEGFNTDGIWMLRLRTVMWGVWFRALCMVFPKLSRYSRLPSIRIIALVSFLNVLPWTSSLFIWTFVVHIFFLCLFSLSYSHFVVMGNLIWLLDRRSLDYYIAYCIDAALLHFDYGI